MTFPSTAEKGLGARRRLQAFLLVCAAVTVFSAAPQQASSARERSTPQIKPPTTEYDALLVSATNPDDVFLGTTHGLYETTDAGRTWALVGLHGHPITSLARIDGRILAAGTGTLAMSDDGGKSWRQLRPHGLPNDDVDALAARGSTVYVVLARAGLFRSRDGARTFRAVSFTVGPSIRALAVTQHHVLAGDLSNGVYLSSDGINWRRTANGMIMALAANARGQLLAASWGIARSTDGGAEWEITLRSHAMFAAVAWAPNRADLAYAVADDHSFWRSTDGGSGWRRITSSIRSHP